MKTSSADLSSFTMLIAPMSMGGLFLVALHLLMVPPYPGILTGLLMGATFHLMNFFSVERNVTRFPADILTGSGLLLICTGTFLSPTGFSPMGFLVQIGVALIIMTLCTTKLSSTNEHKGEPS